MIKTHAIASPMTMQGPMQMGDADGRSTAPSTGIQLMKPGAWLQERRYHGIREDHALHARPLPCIVSTPQSICDAHMNTYEDHASSLYFTSPLAANGLIITCGCRGAPQSWNRFVTARRSAVTASDVLPALSTAHLHVMSTACTRMQHLHAAMTPCCACGTHFLHVLAEHAHVLIKRRRHSTCSQGLPAFPKSSTQPGGQCSRAAPQPALPVSICTSSSGIDEFSMVRKELDSLIR